jgi:hypothetical protein
MKGDAMSNSTVRVRGLVLFLLFGGIFATFAFWIANPASYPFDYYPAGPGGALIIGAPGGAAIIGLIELLSGKPFYEVEDAWASLGTWQRAFGSVLIVVVGGAVAFTAIAMLV